jgi:4-hydroxybenzoate polyprenyltransferase
MVTDEARGTVHGRRSRSALQYGTGWVLREAAISLRLLGNDVGVVFVPTILFAVAAGTHRGLAAGGVLAGVGKAALLSLLFTYVFDCANQAHSGTEDAHNKPYRPIPAGLATEHGLVRRFWLSMPVYTLVGWAFGEWLWVLLWQATVLVQYRWGSSHYYLWWKTPSNIMGTVTTLAAGWQVSAPLDTTAWIWIGTISLYMPLAMVYEDVRDMEGDRASGRRTPALLLGPTVVRRWFAMLMTLLPCVFYFVLARASGAGDWRGVAGAAMIGLVSWTCATRALLLHSPSADRFTFQLFLLSEALTLAMGALLLARS